MKTSNLISKFEKAQTLPILMVMVFAVAALAVLAVDGGSVMVNRRTAQAAADAGAMAGARQFCFSTGASPSEVATNYALMNGATNASAQVSNGLVSVSASVENESFFARIIGEDTLGATAEAVAGCFPPEGNYLLPIAWSCRPSLGATGPFDPGLDCKIMALDWVELLKPLVDTKVNEIEISGNSGLFKMEGKNIINTTTLKPPKQVYIIMDKITTGEELLCKEELDTNDPAYSVAITCDLDGDGKNDIEGGGNRGWLDLTGGGSASAMVSWIRYGLNHRIYPHTWMSGQTGTVTSVYQAIKTYREGRVVWIPVFNAFCNSRYPTTNPACMQAAHAYPFPPEPAQGDTDVSGAAPTFHVVTFTPFYISCVHIYSSDYCPGFALAQQMNPDPKNPGKSLIPNNIPAVEGYFLTNVDRPLDLTSYCDVNLGNCVVSLVK